MRAPIALLASSLTLVGCGQSLDEAVFVQAAIGQPTLVLTQSTLVTQLSGSFDMSLHLGPNADAASTVSLEAASIKDEDETRDIVPLYVTSSVPLPVTLEPDTTVSLTFTIDATQPPLEDPEVVDLCAAAVRVSTIIRDSRQGSAAPLVTSPVVPSGCP